MAEFVVKLADERGRLHQQVEHGYSEAEVRDRFAQQGYLVYWVKPQGLLSGGVSMRRGRRLKHSSFLVFNQQFLTLIRAGLPILNSLELLIKRQKDARLRQLLENVREQDVAKFEIVGIEVKGVPNVRVKNQPVQPSPPTPTPPPKPTPTPPPPPPTGQ